MINDNTILSSFDDKPTLLEWLKKVEDALKTDTATAVSVENPSANTYVFKITFADGSNISSGNVVFPDSVKDVSIKNGHIIVTSVGGNVEDLGVLNPYADTIVVNAVTNDVEINAETKINAGLEVLNELNCDNIVAKGAIQTDRDLGVTGNAQVNGRLQVNSNESVGGGLSVEGALSAKGGITTAGKVTANDGMEVHGQGYVNGSLGLTGNATIGGTITAGGKAIKAVEANPTGEATQTLEKVKIGDVAYNVGGGGGSEYTAGSNIEISQAKEIAVKSALTGVESIKFAPNYGCSLEGDSSGNIHIKTTSPDYSFSHIKFHKNNNPSAVINLYCQTDYSGEQPIRLDASGFKGGDAFAMITRGYVPQVPKTAGTYILKASVQSSGFATYTWELQQ